MTRKISIIETTLRDGQQSLWATRMTTAMMLPILPVMDRVGFFAIEFMATSVMDPCVRYLKENPWERMRLIREKIRNTPLCMVPGTIFSVGSRGILPDDLSSLFVKCCIRNGADQIFIQDGLNDTRNLEVPIRTAKEEGAYVLASVTFSISPVHTDDHFVDRIEPLKKMGADAIVLKDPSGLLTPDRVRTLVPALRRAAGDLPVFCHSHCVTGMGPASNLEAIKAGASGIWTAAQPLANGSSLPSTESMVRGIEIMGFQTDLSAQGVKEISNYFRQVALRYRKPLGEVAEYDPFHYVHQMPGGMITNFRAQLSQLGIEDRLEEVLEEIPRVREDMGWVVMVTPYSQIISTQAALNVLYGRYQVVLDEIEKLVLGYYGKTPAPVKPDILDQIGRGKEPVTERAGSLKAPVVERLRKESGPFRSDEDLLLAAFFMPETLKALREAGPIRTTNPIQGSPLVNLIKEIAKQGAITRFSLLQQ